MKKRKKGKRNYEKENLADYHKCLRKERKREKDRRETDQGSFEACMCHIDFADLDGGGEDGEADSDRPREWESDGGVGAEDVRSFDEPTAMANQSEYDRRLRNARLRLRRHDPGLCRVFNLVVKNGKNREESIWELMTMNGGRRRRQESSIGIT